MEIKTRIVTLIAIFAIGLGGVTYGVIEGLNQGEAAVTANKERCETGNELREGLRNEKNREIHFLKSLPNLFPEAPPGTFDRYINRNVREIRHNRDTVFAPNQC